MSEYQPRSRDSLLDTILQKRPDLGITFLPMEQFGTPVHNKRIRLVTCGRAPDQFCSDSGIRTGSHVVAKCATLRGFEKLLTNVTFGQAIHRISHDLHAHVMLKTKIMMQIYDYAGNDSLLEKLRDCADATHTFLQENAMSNQQMCIPYLAQYIMTIIYLLDFLPGAVSPFPSMGGNGEASAIKYLCEGQYRNADEVIENMRKLIDHRLDGQTSINAIVLKFLSIHRIIQMFGYYSLSDENSFKVQQNRGVNAYLDTVMDTCNWGGLGYNPSKTSYRVNGQRATMSPPSGDTKTFKPLAGAGLTYAQNRLAAQPTYSVDTSNKATVDVAPLQRKNTIRKILFYGKTAEEKKMIYAEIIFPNSPSHINLAGFNEVLEIIRSAKD